MRQEVRNIMDHKVCEVDEEAKAFVVKRDHYYTVIQFHDNLPFTVQNIEESVYEKAG